VNWYYLKFDSALSSRPDNFSRITHDAHEL
jgi:hypothetical protein